MGLSLRSIGRKIEDVVGAGVHDVSHVFGGGQASAQHPPLYQAPRPGPVQAANSPASQSGAYIHPLPPPGLNPPVPTTSTAFVKKAQHPANLTHNPVTNFIGDNVVKPLAQFPIDASNQIYNRVVAPTIGAPKLAPQQVKPIAGVSRAVGATGSLHQTIGSGLQTGLTIASGGLSNAIEGGAAKVLPKVATPIVNRVAPKVVSNAVLGSGFNAAAAGSQGGNPGQIVRSGVEGTAAGLFPVVGAAARPTVRLVSQKIVNAADKVPLTPAVNPSLKVGAKDIIVKPPSSEAVKPTPTVTAPEKAAAATKAVGIPETTVPTGKVITPQTSMPEVNAAVKDVSTQYAKPTKFSGTVQDVVGQAQGRSTIGTSAANGLRKALSNNLSKEENQSVSDILDNHPGALKAATPKAREAAGALKSLQDQGFAVRQAIDPNVNHVRDYVTRIPANSIGGAVNGGTKVLGKIRSLADITNLSSRFSQNRQVGKFVDGKGNATYGNPSNLGLTMHRDGTISDAQGNALKQVAVSKRELEANGAGKYEHNISRISGIYHSDTASLKVRAEALQHIKADPEAMGLSKVQEPDMVPITKVGELSGYFGKPEDVKALEDNFGFKNSTSVPAKVYDAVSNVATQFIVLNPFFHGMNQLYQTGIAAGNLPGHGTGWVKVAQGMAHVTEQDIRDYLAAGGHIPDYGMGRENLLSSVTHGATKINNVAMNAIETKLRTGLYKASIDAGMKPKAAVSNIDKFLGDSHNISAATRRFTLFFHYFKTMGNALYQQGRHPIENAGANVNTATLAALTAAITYGYQEATGNKNAYVRVPGELGLVKEGVQSAAGVVKGNPAKATQVVTNRVNPVLKEGAQQIFNKDLFTGKPVTDTGRLGHAKNALIAPAQVASRVGSGSKSLAETGANQLGLYTPHAKGHEASSTAKFLNTPGAIKGNGIAEQNAYFDSRAKALANLKGDTASTDALNKFLDRSHDPNTGQSIQNSPAESQQNSSALATNDKLRGTVQKFEASQPSHDPMWDLPADKLKALMQYKAQFTGDAAKNFLFAQATSPDGKNNWIKDLEAKQQDFYNNLPHTPGKPPEPNAQTPKYPTFDAFTQGLLDRYDSGSADEKSALLENYGPQIEKAWGQKADWTNAMRKAEGAPALKGYPTASPEVQQILNTYAAVPKGGGSKGGNKYRAEWIQSHPQEYAKMQDYLTQASLSSLVKNASLDQFQGATENQTLLKDIKNLGTYDISTTKNADGTTSYALNPSAAAAAYGSSATGGSSFGSSYKSTANYRAYKDSKALQHSNRIPHIGARIKRPSVKLSKSSHRGTIKAKAPKGSKVAIKASKV